MPPTRRVFLQLASFAGAAFVLRCGPAPTDEAEERQARRLNFWLAIGADGQSELTGAKLEMGQGISTATAGERALRMRRADGPLAQFETTGPSRRLAEALEAPRRPRCTARSQRLDGVVVSKGGAGRFGSRPGTRMEVEL